MRSDRERCASRVAVEQEEEERRGGEEQATDIKSNNPHLAGGELTTKYKKTGFNKKMNMISLPKSSCFLVKYKTRKIIAIQPKNVKIFPQYISTW